MMGKVVKSGKSFGGCVAYCMGKNQAEVLYGEGVRTADTNKVVADFNMQRKLNPSLGQAVGHIALAFSPNDKLMLTDEKMTAIALEYMERMKILNTQVLIVKHNDTQHPHLHIVYNRVNNQGKTISDSMLRHKNVKVAKVLTLEHGLYYSQGKEQVKRQSLKGADKVKYQIFDAIKAASQKAHSIQELESLLKLNGIGVLYKYQNGTQNIQGVSFSKDNYKFKGSEIDRGFSYGNLCKLIEQNILAEQTRKNEPSLVEQIRTALKENNKTRHGEINHAYHPQGGGKFLDTLLTQPFVAGQDDMDDDALKYKKKRKKDRSQGLSR